MKAGLGHHPWFDRGVVRNVSLESPIERVDPPDDRREIELVNFAERPRPAFGECDHLGSRVGLDEVGLFAAARVQLSEDEHARILFAQLAQVAQVEKVLRRDPSGVRLLASR